MAKQIIPATLTATHGIVADVKAVLGGCDLGLAKAAVVGDALDLSLRSLHRKLSAEGVSFGDLLERERQQRCLLALATQPDLTVSQAMDVLGFEAEGAVRRWFSDAFDMNWRHRKQLVRHQPA
ncbi:hypothetical protein A3709_18980 [Halioglobus sp. HI00S01]|uniref:helix-turn-helix domain-containing protein n=1 Tax=Halioglobus sp. HI00S01 TaxID=1822214 RepID=UPI0007C2BCCB|nr:helix-turn-helix domain-containing protein [Halioglobus sp. HI00S01]KZX57709.1 hypothetical protein A3709_18980 [Halioglobus sp. HI00S01]